jgi:hypothetical protein
MDMGHGLSCLAPTLHQRSQADHQRQFQQYNRYLHICLRYYNPFRGERVAHPLRNRGFSGFGGVPNRHFFERMKYPDRNDASESSPCRLL